MADPKIRFDILANAQGAGEVSQLANELEKLDGSLDPALAARAKETAAQLREVGRQQEAITTFKQLKTASTDTAAALKQAQAQAQALAREISASGTPTRTQAGQMEKLREAVRTAKDEHTKSVQKLQEHRQAMVDAGVSTSSLAARQAELSARQKVLRSDAGEIAGKYREQADAAKASASTQSQAADRIEDGNERIGKSADSATELVKGLGGALAAGFTFNELVQAASQMETIKAGLLAVTGSADLAGKEFEFVRQVANRVGADVTQVGQAFLGLSAATRGTAVEGEPTRQVFEAVAAAMGKAGKSSAETENALVALAQIASKGTVSMEELRGQLGEALPGALQAAANGLGVTTQDLIQLVEQGKIAAEDLFPALTQGLNELYGSGGQGAQTLAQEITNIKNQFVELADSLGENGGLDALKTGAEIAQSALVLLDDALITIGKTVGTIAGAVATLDFSGLTDAFAQIEQESRDKLLRAAQHNQVLANYINAVGNEALQAALKQQQLAASTERAGGAAVANGTTFVGLAAAYSKVSAELAKQIEGAEQSRLAREAEGKASVAITQAFGTEAEKRAAAAAATAQDAAQLVEIARLRQQDVELLKAEFAAKQAMLAVNGGASEQRQKELDALTLEIQKRQDVAAKAIAQAQASQLSAAAAQAESLAMQDNSARVEELAAAYETARLKADTLRLAKEGGVAVNAQLAAAEIEAGKAAALYKDALNDQLSALEAKRLAETANLNLKQLSVKVAIEEQRSIAAVARARGDVYAATNAENEIRKLEIQLVVLSADAKRAEARSMLAGVEATRAQLEASGQLTAVKRAELDASIAKAKALEMEAQIGDITAQRMRDLANATSQSGNAAVGAAAGHDVLRESLGNVGSSADNTKGSVDRLSDALRRLQQLQNKPSPNPLQGGGGVANPAPYGYTADGFIANKDGSAAGTFNNNIPIDKAFAVKQAAETGDYSGITLSDAQAAYKQALDAQAWMEATIRNNPAGVSYQARTDTMAMVAAAKNALERLGGSTAGSGARGISQAGRTSTVVIKMGGKSTSVNTASDADADALTDMLKQLQNAAGRTS